MDATLVWRDDNLAYLDSIALYQAAERRRFPPPPMQAGDKAPDGQSSCGHIQLDQGAFDKVDGIDRRSTSTAINRCRELGVCSVSKLFIIK